MSEGQLDMGGGQQKQVRGSKNRWGVGTTDGRQQNGWGVGATGGRQLKRVRGS